MEQIFQSIYVEGDVIATAVNVFILGFILTFVLGFVNILKDANKTARS